MPYERTLQKILESTDKELYGRLSHLETLAKKLLIYTQGKFPYYTPHDFQHSLAVEENLNWLILDPIKEKLNKYEIFFLICAAWLHDWGMIGEENEIPEEIRENHHIRTENYFETKYNTLGFSFHEGRIIGRICKGHRKIDLHSEEYEDMTFGQGIRIQTRFLAALLRIADETDVTHSRTPEVIYYTINPSGKSKEEFEKHLNITGIGQLDEPHKIYITAIARDPRGAKTLRELTLKIQHELDTVKSILTQNGLYLDIVELKLEARGFIDKPIGFEINRNKVVDLLIGKHLYGKIDVSIRELVQNSLDTCNLKKINQTSYNPEIFLVRENENSLTISDNGVGMSYTEAKRFLSNIGTSFYDSEEFKKTLIDKPYDPISFFGIGLLSSFLIADGLIIETKKDNEDGCKFTISSFSEDWKYEKGSLKSSGTAITLNLNSEGKKISILESLNRYFVSPDILITYKEIDSEAKVFISSWSINIIEERFLENEEKRNPKSLKEIVSLNKKGYDAYLVYSPNYFYNQLILFNHGVFVECIDLAGMANNYCVFLNLKSNLIDLHISRENVIKNDKWTSFINAMFNELLDSIREINPDSEFRNFISIVSSMIETRLTIEEKYCDKLSENFPFLNSVLSRIPLPLVTDGTLEWALFNEILEGETISLYKCNSNEYKEEISVYCKANKQGKTFFNPYRMPKVTNIYNDNESFELIEYLYKQKNPKFEKSDLRTLLINISKPLKGDYSKILPSNVKFASFGELKPVVVVHKYPTVKEKHYYFGSSYWGNILLWNQLIEKDRRRAYIKSLRDYSDRRYESIKTVVEHTVLVDSTDSFMAAIIKKYDDLNIDQCQTLKRYFKYLSYLPLVVHNMASCLIFIEVIDSIEHSLSVSLGLKRPQELFKRMQPNSKLYLQYFKKNDMPYIKV
ncbi:MAG TPA: ATP-binding protein [Prolixibacteraceae bacterium]|nr:ATP-binding protein [Prolixibacteraceae bacterium]